MMRSPFHIAIQRAQRIRAQRELAKALRNRLEWILKVLRAAWLASEGCNESDREGLRATGERIRDALDATRDDFHAGRYAHVTRCLLPIAAEAEPLASAIEGRDA
jgi:type II secretory pathway component PulJ